MQLVVYPFTIAVFLSLAVVTSRLLSKTNAKNPEIEWVLGVWMINIISYITVTEYLGIEIIYGIIFFLIISTTTYIKIVVIRWKYAILFNSSSSLALFSFLVLFGVFPNQTSDVKIKKIAQDICSCKSELCTSITTRQLPEDFMSNPKWVSQVDKIEKCTFDTKEMKLAVSNPLAFFKDQEDEILAEKKRGLIAGNEPSLLTIKKIHSEKETIEDEKPELTEVKEYRYVTIKKDDYSKYIKETVKLTKKSGVAVNGVLLAVNNNNIELRRHVSGGYVVMPIQKKSIKDIEINKLFITYLKK